jgi:predicted metal-dependent phosphoesterase TrpH
VSHLRRHLLAVALGLVVLGAAFVSLPGIVDVLTGAPPGDADLVRPTFYVLTAPLSNTLDALTFLSLERAKAFLLSWVVLLALWGALRRGSGRRRVVRAVLGALIPVGFAVATVLLPRPVPRLVTTDPGVSVLDFHSHTKASHDGRPGWTLERVAAWHAAQGFQAAYITDHNKPSAGSTDGAIPMLPGVEWSVYRQHIVALGDSAPLDLAPYSRDTPGMLSLFATLHTQGALAIGSLPEYWVNHREDLEQFVAAGVDGFEVVNCAPKALAFPSSARGDVIDLARHHDVLVTGASDNHGWGRVTCVWNLSFAGAHGFASNHVVARPLALAQGDLPAAQAGWSQLWWMFRTLNWPERISWLTWILLIAIWRDPRRRKGQGAGIGILARELGRRQESDQSDTT